MSVEIRVLALVQDKIDKLRQDQVEFLAAERATSFEEYKKVCGVIRGLSLTDLIINDLVQRIKND